MSRQLSKRETEIALTLRASRPNVTAQEGMSNAAKQRAAIADEAASSAWWNVVSEFCRFVHEDRCNIFLDAVRRRSDE